ncbi:MAG: DSD1 family PLP-dependent enzyme [Chloroflexi bacterium]|nr:DSD1 family PLP-dependent enzyme [Chloroflexota bacterium]
MDLQYFPLPGAPIDEIDTPAIIVDLDVAEANIARLQDFGDANGTSIRPHSKTHKSPVFARKQIEAGAIGVCCAKVGEAEAMVAGGVKDILIPNQVIGATKIARLVALASEANIVVAADDPDNVRQLSAVASAAGKVVGVIVEVNVGMDRCGTEPGEDTTALARVIADSPGLRFDGVMGYEGHTVAVRDESERRANAEIAMAKLIGAADNIEAAGLPVKVISAAGTGTYNITGKMDRITDLQCGSYIFMDGDYLEVFDDFSPALTVLATVISRPTSDRAVLDTGMKAMSIDRGLPIVVGAPGAEFTKISEEHGVMSVEGEAQRLKVGDKVHLRPMHGDTTINLHSHYFGVRNGRLDSVIEIAGRGRFR